MSEPPNEPPPQKRIRVYKGWEAISEALDVDEDTALKYASRSFDPLYIYYDHQGRACSPVDALESWEMRQALPFRAYHELRRIGRLPSQIVTREDRKATRRTKVARRSGTKEPRTRVNSG